MNGHNLDPSPFLFFFFFFQRFWLQQKLQEFQTQLTPISLKYAFALHYELKFFVVYRFFSSESNRFSV